MNSTSLRILLIEDNAMDARLIHESLARTIGFQVEVAHVERLSQGLTRLTAEPFDAALLDLNLPDSVGLHTVSQVHARHPNVPIVVLTGEAACELGLQAVKAGAEDYIRKVELQPQLLVRTIQYAIERAGRRNADERLSQYDIRYRTLFEESPDGVLLIDPQTCQHVEFNHAACRQLGYSREEFGRLRIFDYEARETPAETRARVAAVLRQGRADFETQHRVRTGELRDVLVTVQMIALGGRQLLHTIYRDITEYRATENALFETQERFAAFVSESTYGYAELDQEGRILFVNWRLLDTLGYTAEEVFGHKFTAYLPVGDRARVRAAFRRALVQPPTDASWVYTLGTKDGSARIFLVNAIPLLSRRTPVRLLALFLDVTDQRHAEETLRRSEAKLRSLFETLPGVVLMVDRGGRVEFANRELPGGTLADLRAAKDFSYITPPQQHRCREALERTIVTGHVETVEALDIHGNWWECRFASMAEAGVPDHAMIICTDITRHRKVELALGEREQRYRELLAAVTSYAYSVRLENGVPVSTDHSWGCLAVTGYTPEDYRSNPYLWIDMVHADDQESVRQHVAAILAGQNVPAIEHRIVLRDGRIRWVRDTVVPHHDGEVLVRYDGIVEDVTDRRRAERTLQDHEVQLLAAQKIQERLLPTRPPALPGFDISGAVYPAEFTAGDFYDYLTMPDGHLGFVISDVLGHGFGSALLMASTSTLVRMLAETQTDVGEILGRVNGFLAKETDDYFVTLFLGCLDPHRRSFVYASGGHPPGYVLDASGHIKARLESTAMPLAVFPDTQFPTAGPVVLEPGDIVLLSTDGIHEAMAPDGEILGMDRVLDVVRANRQRTASGIVECLRRLVYEFCQRDHLSDDVTAVVIKVQP